MLPLRSGVPWISSETINSRAKAHLRLPPSEATRRFPPFWLPRRPFASREKKRRFARASLCESRARAPGPRRANAPPPPPPPHVFSQNSERSGPSGRGGSLGAETRPRPGSAQRLIGMRWARRRVSRFASACARTSPSQVKPGMSPDWGEQSLSRSKKLRPFLLM